MSTDRVAELEAQLKQARIETKAIGKQVHDALAAWSKEMDDHKAHEIAKQNLVLHQQLLDSGEVVVRLRNELHQLTKNDKEKEFDSFNETQVERELETGVDSPIAISAAA